MANIWCEKRGSRLYAASRAACMELNRIPEGAGVSVKISRPRNPAHHRLLWAFLTYVADALNSGPAPTLKEWSPDDVLRHIKIATGHVEPVKVPKSRVADLGETAWTPSSISFARMDQTEFAAFFNAALAYVRDDLCPWLMDSDCKREIEAIIEGARQKADAA